MTDELRANDNAISLQAAYESGRASRDAEVEALKRGIPISKWAECYGYGFISGVAFMIVLILVLAR